MLLFFNDTATTEIYTLSLHDALPICGWVNYFALGDASRCFGFVKDWVEKKGRRHLMRARKLRGLDRKSTRLNSSHANISYAVFCLKKQKLDKTRTINAATIVRSMTQT